MCATVTNGGNLLRKFKTSAILVEFMPAFSGIPLNMLLRMYSIYWGTSRKFKSWARFAITTPVSSSCSSSSKAVVVSAGNDRLLELAAEGEEVVRFRPNAATALFLLGLVMRDECAAVAWKDMLKGGKGVQAAGYCQSGERCLQFLSCK